MMVAIPNVMPAGHCVSAAGIGSDQRDAGSNLADLSA